MPPHRCISPPVPSRVTPAPRSIPFSSKQLHPVGIAEKVLVSVEREAVKIRMLCPFALGPRADKSVTARPARKVLARRRRTRH